MRRSVVVPVVVMTLLLTCPFVLENSSATTVVPVTTEDLARDADAIVIGSVTAITSAWRDAESRIVTYIALSLDDVLKGAPRRQLTIRQAGGTLGDLHAGIDGSPEFEVGERVFLFLHRNPDGTARVAHLYQGKFSLVSDPMSGRQWAFRDPQPAGVQILPGWRGAAAPVPDPAHFHEVDDLRARVLAIVSQHAGRGQGPRAIVDADVTGATAVQANFTFLSTPARWFEPDTGVPVPMRMDQTGQPGVSGLGFDAVRAAYQAWSNVPGSNFRYQDAGFTTTRGFQLDYQNVVTFGDPFNEISAPVGCRGTVAFGGYHRFDVYQRVVNGTTFSQIIDGDLVIADGWSGCGFYEVFNNFAEVVTHELGHVLGLGHSSSNDATMRATVHWDGRGASLKADDIAGLTFIYPGGGTPDLIVSSVGNPPATSAGGGGFVANDVVTNQGTASAGGSMTRFYLSLNTQWDAGDIQLSGSRLLDTLAVGGTSGGSVGVTVPSSITGGAYYLLACADDTHQVSESNETNNCRASSTTVQVAGPPSAPPPAGGADLVVTELLNPPSSAAAGTSFGARDWVLNQGTATAGASATRFYLSLDAARDPADVLLTGTRTLSNLSPGATSKGTITVTIPISTPSGLYFLLACTDDLNQVGEGNETNNCRASQTRIQVGTGFRDRHLDPAARRCRLGERPRHQLRVRLHRDVHGRRQRDPHRNSG